MTDQTPIDRAAQALPGALASVEQLEYLARAVFASIDTDMLSVIVRENLVSLNPAGYHVIGDPHHLALAVKNWLTGKDQQQ